MGLRLASAFTLGLLASMLFAVIGGLAVFTGAFNFYLVLGLVILFNIVMWLISPKISDLTYSWVYDTEWIDLEELREISPESAEVIEEVTDEYDYKVPKLGIIQDSNPQAFTYGSDRWNARILVTEGLFEYLDDNEAASVYAHELGHVTNRDFIIMTIANTIVQVMYLTYIYLRRNAIRARDRAAAVYLGFAIISFAFYFVGRYLVYYLSRIREYYADRFAGKHTDPNYLSSALIKISYGIMDSPDNEDLMKATETMGVMNLEQGEEKGALYYNASNLQNWDPLAKAFLFDLKNPWASLLELKSTHPLTGKRVKALEETSSNPMFNFEELKQRFEIDKKRLYGNFFKDLTVVGLPTVLLVLIPLAYFLGLITGTLPEMNVFMLGLWVSVLGSGQIMKTLYKYPWSGEPEKKTVLELLGNIYASPVRGSKTALKGKIIGRGNAGYRFGSDLMFKDDTGIMHLRYQSIIPVIGNFLFGWRKAEDYIDSEVKVRGWFLRGLTPRTAMRKLNEDNSWPHFHSIFWGSLILAVGLLVMLAGLF